MQLLKQRFRNPVYVAGLSCLAGSLFFYSLPFFSNMEGDYFGLFVMNYALTVVYFFIMVFSKGRVKQEDKIHHTFLFLILAFVSAWALNRAAPVFNTSATWFAGLLILLCLNYAAFAYTDALPKWAVHGMSFTAGIGLATFIYLTIYLLPLYPISAIGLFFFGISIHSFIPMLFVIYTLILITKLRAKNRRFITSFLTGLLFAILFVTCYIGLWGQVKKEVHRALFQNSIDKRYPGWVSVVQEVPSGFFVKKMMKTELVYSIPDWRHDFILDDVPFGLGDEDHIHDPLVVLAVTMAGEPVLDGDSKVRILESMYGMRHEAEEKLWSDEHLVTDQVNTAVKLWPACNIAYTEQTITVANEQDKKAWRRQEEALYTFYLPEGGVVTSLSLWINGVEEKGIMTTKEKANVAYKTIVGVESRDPSVVHWREGNTVSVRVFPVMAGDNRMFKIGITAPLRRVSGKLQYDNIYFKGPAYDDAGEIIQFEFEQPAFDFQFPASFTSMSNQSYSRKGKYEPVWSMQIKDPGLANCTFSFDNNIYSLAPYHKKLSPAPFSSVYLDINKSWTRAEFDKITGLARDKDVFVFDSELVKVTQGNREELWSRLHGKQFSLFPLYEINDPVRSLMITKNTAVSPSLKDLDGTNFMSQTNAFLRRDQKVKVFDLGAQPSPYLKTLKEFRAFQYDKGDLQSLIDILDREHFPDDVENDRQVIIHEADMIIQRNEGSCDSSGPDHLVRLFTYNHIMQQLGTGLLINRPVGDTLVEEARKAYVVTPVSSLVVLESKEDYDRFDIHDANKSLKNASMASKGAVPEPHEWAVIVAALLVMGWVIKGKKLRFG